jgi:hypothetical protein
MAQSGSTTSFDERAWLVTWPLTDQSSHIQSLGACRFPDHGMKIAGDQDRQQQATEGIAESRRFGRVCRR